MNIITLAVCKTNELDYPRGNVPNDNGLGGIATWEDCKSLCNTPGPDGFVHITTNDAYNEHCWCKDTKSTGESMTPNNPALITINFGLIDCTGKNLKPSKLVRYWRRTAQM